MNIKKIGTQANGQQPVMSLFGEPNRIQHSSMQINNYKIRLNDDIIEPSAYNDELSVIEDLSENDSCTIIFNSGGGHLDTCVDFLAAIDASEGHCHGHISGICHSAASMIFLRCHSWSISKYSSMLIHNASGGFVGKMSDTFKQAAHFEKWLHNFFKDIYEDFLTDEEIEEVLEGKDLWLNSEQLEERLIKLSEIRTEKMEQAMLEEDSEEAPLLDADEDLEDQEGDCIGDCKNSVEASTQLAEDIPYDGEFPSRWFSNYNTEFDEVSPENVPVNATVEVIDRVGGTEIDCEDVFDWSVTGDHEDIIMYRILGLYSEDTYESCGE